MTIAIHDPVSEAIRHVFAYPPEWHPPSRIGALLDRLRLAHNLNYEQSYKRITQQFPKLTLAEYEAYCQHAEYIGEEGDKNDN